MEVTQPEENVREVSLKTGNKIRLTRKDPFGLWYFSFERGPVPKELEGAFTKIDYAMKYLENLANNGKFDLGTPEPKAPPVATKKVTPKQEALAKELLEADSAKREASAS